MVYVLITCVWALCNCVIIKGVQTKTTMDAHTDRYTINDEKIKRTFINLIKNTELRARRTRVP